MDLAGVYIQFICEFLGRRWAPHFLLQIMRFFIHLSNAVGHVNRDANCAPLIRDRSCNGLANPPCSISGEAKSTAIVILLN